MAKPIVLMSHGHVDDASAERLACNLNPAGADAWLDKIDLGAGARIEEVRRDRASLEEVFLSLMEEGQR